MAYPRLLVNCPIPTEVLKGKVKTLDTQERAFIFGRYSLCYELKEANDKGDKVSKKVNNFFQRFPWITLILNWLWVLNLHLHNGLPSIDPDEVECFDKFLKSTASILKSTGVPVEAFWVGDFGPFLILLVDI